MNMKQLSILAVLAAPIVAGIGLTQAARAIDVPAGPIWNNDDAKAKCPRMCTALEWNGQWRTTQEGVMSVCGTAVGDIPVGPIWNNDDAKTKCPAQLAKMTWNGQWRTIQENTMSVCGCTPPRPAR